MSKPSYIYVASSWRNHLQQGVVGKLRAAGLEVYDYQNPLSGERGVSWREISPAWQDWTPREWRDALNHPVAQHNFRQDKEAIDRADCCVLVLPCGRSAHLEAGYCAGQGKPVYTLALERVEPELMALLLGPYCHICTTMDELLERLGAPS